MTVESEPPATPAEASVDCTPNLAAYQAGFALEVLRRFTRDAAKGLAPSWCRRVGELWLYHTLAAARRARTPDGREPPPNPGAVELLLSVHRFIGIVPSRNSTAQRPNGERGKSGRLRRGRGSSATGYDELWPDVMRRWGALWATVPDTVVLWRELGTAIATVLHAGPNEQHGAALDQVRTLLRLVAGQETFALLPAKLREGAAQFAGRSSWPELQEGAPDDWYRTCAGELVRGLHDALVERGEPLPPLTEPPGGFSASLTSPWAVGRAGQRFVVAPAAVEERLDEVSTESREEAAEASDAVAIDPVATDRSTQEDPLEAVTPHVIEPRNEEMPDKLAGLQSYHAGHALRVLWGHTQVRLSGGETHWFAPEPEPWSELLRDTLLSATGLRRDKWPYAKALDEIDRQLAWACRLVAPDGMPAEYRVERDWLPGDRYGDFPAEWREDCPVESAWRGVTNTWARVWGQRALGLNVWRELGETVATVLLQALHDKTTSAIGRMQFLLELVADRYPITALPDGLPRRVTEFVRGDQWPFDIEPDINGWQRAEAISLADRLHHGLAEMAGVRLLLPWVGAVSPIYQRLDPQEGFDENDAP